MSQEYITVWQREEQDEEHQQEPEAPHDGELEASQTETGGEQQPQTRRRRLVYLMGTTIYTIKNSEKNNNLSRKEKKLLPQQHKEEQQQLARALVHDTDPDVLFVQQDWEGLKRYFVLNTDEFVYDLWNKKCLVRGTLSSPQRKSAAEGGEESSGKAEEERRDTNDDTDKTASESEAAKNTSSTEQQQQQQQPTPSPFTDPVILRPYKKRDSILYSHLGPAVDFEKDAAVVGVAAAIHQAQKQQQQGLQQRQADFSYCCDIVLGEVDYRVMRNRFIKSFAWTVATFFFHPFRIGHMIAGFGDSLGLRRGKAGITTLREQIRYNTKSVQNVSPPVHDACIAERDQNIASLIDTLMPPPLSSRSSKDDDKSYKVMVAVMGMGHMDGVEKNLQERGWTQVKMVPDKATEA